MLLKVVDGTEFRDIPITEGSFFLLPGMFVVCSLDTYHCLTFGHPVTSANTPHNPVRFPDSVGIVIEGTRPETSKGGLHLGSLQAPY